jgi:hypothetical protein
MNVCSVCNTQGDTGSKELRPYGKNGSQICFDCMMATPENEEEARRQCNAKMDAIHESGDVVVITDDGIIPLSELVKR